METSNMALDPGGRVICYKIPENSAELCFAVGKKIELVSDEVRYLTEEISKQSVAAAD